VAKFMLAAAAAGSYTAAAIEPIAAPLDAAFLFLDAAGIGQRFTSQLLQQLCSSHKLDLPSQQ
jgi:hypothetical protein